MKFVVRNKYWGLYLLTMPNVIASWGRLEEAQRFTRAEAEALEMALEWTEAISEHNARVLEGEAA